MRKISYVITFVVVAITLLFNVFTMTRSDWLIVQTPEILHTKITISYGLHQLCERRVTRIPAESDTEIIHYECRRFPKKVTDHCENENAGACASWISARYFVDLAAWTATVSLCAIAFGVSTHSRRRRIWRVAAGLIFLQATFQVIAFGIVTDLYQNARFQAFEYARLGPAYILNIVSWILGFTSGIAVISTGISADRGHRWAAGNRAYMPIA